MTPEPPPIPRKRYLPSAPPPRVWGLKPWSWAAVFCLALSFYAFWEVSGSGSMGSASNAPYIVIFGTLYALFICCIFVAVHAILIALPARGKIIIGLETLAVSTFIALSVAHRSAFNASPYGYFHFHTGAHLPIKAEVIQWGVIHGLNEGWGCIVLQLSAEDFTRLLSRLPPTDAERPGPTVVSEDQGGFYERRAKNLGIKMQGTYPAELWLREGKSRTKLEALWFPKEERAYFFLSR